MNAQLFSDLHLEFLEDRGKKFLTAVVPKADNLILAGDITSLTKEYNLDLVFSILSPKYKNIIYTIGNHEVYFRSITAGWELIRKVQSNYNNVHCLNNEEVMIDNVNIYGGTGWFPPSLHPNRRQLISDFKLISDVEPNAYLSNYSFKKLLQHSSPDLIVTHHLPNDLCVHPMYKGSPLNDYFVMGLPEGISDAKLHVFGHTHFSMDFTHEGCRYVSNPKGYPKDREANWNPDLVLEV